MFPDLFTYVVQAVAWVVLLGIPAYAMGAAWKMQRLQRTERR